MKFYTCEVKKCIQNISLWTPLSWTRTGEHLEQQRLYKIVLEMIQHVKVWERICP